MFLTMVISGFWHGAAWTFVIWGALHAVGRVLTRELERTSLYRDKVPTVVKQALVFAFVTFTWIFFRAKTLDDAWTIVTGIFSPGWGDPGFPLLALGLVLAVWAYQFLYESRARWVLELAPVRVGLAVCMMLYLAIVPGSKVQAFIYFQF
jgi:D-alanyl-lipoteichoic acid acyltransferase DltB (MBOAT superfamily)